MARALGTQDGTSSRQQVRTEDVHATTTAIESDIVEDAADHHVHPGGDHQQPGMRHQVGHDPFEDPCA